MDIVVLVDCFPTWGGVVVYASLLVAIILDKTYRRRSRLHGRIPER